MSHIVEFTVKGLAGRKEPYTQKLDRNLNIFFGHNGSGKTSLLRILDGAMSADADSLRMVPFESASVKIYSITHDVEFVRTIERPTRSKVIHGDIADQDEELVETLSESTEYRIFISSSRHDFQSFKWETTGLPPHAATGFSHIYLPTWRAFSGGGRHLSSADRGMDIAGNEESEWDRIFARRLETLWVRFSNQLLTQVQTIQRDGIAEVLHSILTPGSSSSRRKDLDADDAFQRARSFLSRQGSRRRLGSRKEFSKKYDSDPQLRSVVAGIDSLEEKISTTMATQDNLEQLIREMFTGPKTVTFESTGIKVKSDDGDEISLETLSSGEKQALGIFIDVLRADQHSLMIDEPELSMHIDWQNRLVAAMQMLNPEAQLILATHSPEIMANVPDENIFRL